MIVTLLHVQRRDVIPALWLYPQEQTHDWTSIRVPKLRFDLDGSRAMHSLTCHVRFPFLRFLPQHLKEAIPSCSLSLCELRELPRARHHVHFSNEFSFLSNVPHVSLCAAALNSRADPALNPFRFSIFPRFHEL